jgi:hypothetical protein
MARRGEIGISHPQIEDVCAAIAGLGLDPVHLLENIGRKALDSVKVVHGVS